MGRHRLQFPEELRTAIEKRYLNQRRKWLVEQGHWPLVFSLGCPTESEAEQEADAVRGWIAEWQAWTGVGEIVWSERRWHRLGIQRLPEQLLLRTAQEVAACLGETTRWRKACSHYLQLISRWPALTECLPRYFDALADRTDSEIQRIEAILGWLDANPRSSLYPRQLPIAGLDTKWLENRKGLIGDLFAALRTDTNTTADFFECCGLRRTPHLVRVRILDKDIRKYVGGIGDISAPADELAKLDMPVRHAFIVENLQTGLAFDDIPESVVFMRLGYDVEVLSRMTWLRGARCIYWGDIDTHGFDILNRVRIFVPNVESILMDTDTLLRHENLWGEEPEQCSSEDLPLLADAERFVYQGLKRHQWGIRVRLEQERIAWDTASVALQAAIAPSQSR